MRMVTGSACPLGLYSRGTGLVTWHLVGVRADTLITSSDQDESPRFPRAGSVGVQQSRTRGKSEFSLRCP